MSFTGEFRHTIDVKGRLIVPSRLRDELEGDKVVLAKWPDGCIAVWSGPGWRGLEEKLLQLASSDSTSRRVVRAMASSAHTDEVDRQGRITVPGHLREHAGIERDVVVAGALDHGELWSPDRWDREASMVEPDNFDQLVQGLNF